MGAHAEALLPKSDLLLPPIARAPSDTMTIMAVSTAHRRCKSTAAVISLTRIHDDDRRGRGQEH